MSEAPITVNLSVVDNVSASIDHLQIELGAPFIVEVRENGSPEWIRNGLHFATDEEADRWAFDLMMRWFGIEAYRVVDTRSGEVVRA